MGVIKFRKTRVILRLCYALRFRTEVEGPCRWSCQTGGSCAWASPGHPEPPGTARTRLSYCWCANLSAFQKEKGLREFCWSGRCRRDLGDRWMSLLSHAKCPCAGALGSAAPGLRALSLRGVSGSDMCWGHENCSFFWLLFSHYFEEFCKVQSAEAKLFKGGVKFRTAEKQSEILALFFLSKKSLYPTHRGRQPLGQDVGFPWICKGWGFVGDLISLLLMPQEWKKKSAFFMGTNSRA